MFLRALTTTGLACALAASGCVEDHEARIYDTRGACWQANLDVTSWTTRDEECAQGEALATDKWGTCFVFPDGCVPGRFRRVNNSDELCARRLRDAPACL